MDRVSTELDAHQDFWNKRCVTFGHTGWRFSSLAEYDQSIRKKAIFRALQKFGFSFEHLKVLDMGCGKGDFIEEFYSRGAHVTGVDISSEAIESARYRFEGIEQIKLTCADLKFLPLEKEQFDLILSVTVLQHILSDQEITLALKKFNRSLCEKGVLTVLESCKSPILGEADESYIRLRTVPQWRKIFQEGGFVSVLELSYPQYGLVSAFALKRLLHSFSGSSSEHPTLSKPSRKTEQILNFFLSLFRPVDHWLSLPTPAWLSPYRIYVLRKFK